MQPKTTCIELRSSSGALLFTALVYEKFIHLPEGSLSKPTEEPKQTPGVQPQPTNGRLERRVPSAVTKPADGPHDALITDSQKRYLFRLMAHRGFEGNQAFDELKKLFKVSTLKEVTKHEASEVIDRLVQEHAKRGENHD